MIGGADEVPLYFEGSGVDLAGVLTVPHSPNGIAILIPWGGGAYPSSGKNRIRTRLARAVAEDGYHAFRFDYEGVGESGGTYRVADMRSAFRSDILSALRLLQREGLHRVIVVANCIGGFSSVTSAHKMPGLEGMVVVRAPVSRDHQQVQGAERSMADWLRGVKRFKLRYLRDPRRRATYRKMIGAKVRSVLPGRIIGAGGSGGSGGSGGESRFGQGVRYLLANDLPLLLLYSNDDHFHHDLVAELAGGLGAELERAGPTTRLVLTEERLQGWGSLAAQALLDRRGPGLVARGRRPQGGGTGPRFRGRFRRLRRRNSSAVLTWGKGSSGTATPSAAASGAHPSPGRHSTSRSGGTVERTSSLWRS